jgi:DNA-binding MarR family transcriptional regulator
MTDSRLGSRKTLSGSSYESAEVSPGFLFWKTFNAWTRVLRGELEKLDLTQVQFSILAAVSYLSSAGEEVSQQSVANHLSMDKMMVSDVVKTLGRKKFLQRSPHSLDRRAFALRLTSAGKNKLQKAVPVVEATDENFFGVLSPSQRRVFLAHLEQLTKKRK